MQDEIERLAAGWTAVDQYFADLLIPNDPVLDAALQTIADAGLPAISVSPLQGKLLYLMALMMGAKSVLEVGTLGAYSTIWLARALPKEGKLITLEVDPKHTEVARKNLAGAKLSASIEVRLGDALHALPLLAAEGAGPFDLVFIDADKVNTPAYFEWALKLTKSGSVIVVDNVVRKGAVVDTASGDSSVRGIRRFNELLAAEPRVTATAIQTVGSKGYDGFAVARVK